MHAFSYSFLSKQKSNRLAYKLLFFLVRLIDYPYRYVAAYSFAQNSQSHASLKVSSNSYCFSRKNDSVNIGQDCVIRGILRADYSGEITIGNNCYIGDDTILYSLENIKVGNNVLIADNVRIFDNNSHPTDPFVREKHFASFLEPASQLDFSESIDKDAVVVNDNVWIGFGAIVLKGVEIGANSIIASGSTITSDCPPNSLVTGINQVMDLGLKAEPKASS